MRQVAACAAAVPHLAHCPLDAEAYDGVDVLYVHDGVGHRELRFCALRCQPASENSYTVSIDVRLRL